LTNNRGMSLQLDLILFSSLPLSWLSLVLLGLSSLPLLTIKLAFIGLVCHSRKQKVANHSVRGGNRPSRFPPSARHIGKCPTRISPQAWFWVQATGVALWCSVSGLVFRFQASAPAGGAAAGLLGVILWVLRGSLAWTPAQPKPHAEFRGLVAGNQRCSLRRSRSQVSMAHRGT